MSEAVLNIRQAHLRAISEQAKVVPHQGYRFAMTGGVSNPEDAASAAAEIQSVLDALIPQGDRDNEPLKFAVSQAAGRVDAVAERQVAMARDMDALQVAADGLLARCVDALRRAGSIEATLLQEHTAVSELRAKTSFLEAKLVRDAAAIASLSAAKRTAEHAADMNRRKIAECESLLAAITHRATSAEEACAALHVSFLETHSALQQALATAESADRLIDVPPESPAVVPSVAPQCSCRCVRHFSFSSADEGSAEISSSHVPDRTHVASLAQLEEILRDSPADAGIAANDSGTVRAWGMAIDRLSGLLLEPRPPRERKASHAQPKRSCAACGRAIGTKSSAACESCGADVH
eukprot:CAMPEP_0174853744 /NCGR_PEP_ID=MMETSP1114-20130205/29551_1 /TAXON_ID=312471 /ORGANISM="Neobodo designis, Strain CCAP 1951/1" /LENGTH=350 /DNA_ID=CAMNT_0016088411 /DNA_START=27 /DNA_END=1076 /DNA_ORIENTATION=-